MSRPLPAPDNPYSPQEAPLPVVLAETWRRYALVAAGLLAVILGCDLVLALEASPMLTLLSVVIRVSLLLHGALSLLRAGFHRARGQADDAKSWFATATVFLGVTAISLPPLAVSIWLVQPP